jgi:hypothetical protein
MSELTPSERTAAESRLIEVVAILAEMRKSHSVDLHEWHRLMVERLDLEAKLGPAAVAASKLLP